MFSLYPYIERTGRKLKERINHLKLYMDENDKSKREENCLEVTARWGYSLILKILLGPLLLSSYINQYPIRKDI